MKPLLRSNRRRTKRKITNDMYYAEKVIDGVLHFKTRPDGQWKELSLETLTSRLIKAERKLNEER